MNSWNKCKECNQRLNSYAKNGAESDANLQIGTVDNLRHQLRKTRREEPKSMKLKPIIKLSTAVAVTFGALLGLWWYEAKSPKAKGVLINIPMWMAGGYTTNGYIRYSVYIHHTQIRPWGTVWKETCVRDASN